ncbi:MAG: hypothetical protein WBB98_12020 [Xanthobacteraceae bacterium]
MNNAVENYKIVCAKCNVPVKGKSGDDEADIFSCPECGTSASRASIMEEAKAYQAEQDARALQEVAKQSATEIGWMTYEEHPLEPREYRFKAVPR